MTDERTTIADYIEQRAERCARRAADLQHKDELACDAVMLRALAADIRAGLHQPD
jgi:hypothetical protein